MEELDVVLIVERGLLVHCRTTHSSFRPKTIAIQASREGGRALRKGAFLPSKHLLRRLL